MPSGVAYDVFGVATQLLQSSANADGGTFSVAQDSQALISNLINIQNNGVLSWDFTQTQVDICPVILAGAGGGAFGAISQNAAGANSGAMNNGNGSIWMYRKHPVGTARSLSFCVSVAARLLSVPTLLVSVLSFLAITRTSLRLGRFNLRFREVNARRSSFPRGLTASGVSCVGAHSTKIWPSVPRFGASMLPLTSIELLLMPSFGDTHEV